MYVISYSLRLTLFRVILRHLNVTSATIITKKFVLGKAGSENHLFFPVFGHDRDLTSSYDI